MVTSSVPVGGAGGGSGTEADLAVMRSSATEAASIADQLLAAVKQLDSAMSPLSAMDGAIKQPFWQGHQNHNDAVTRLSAKLHQMADGITGAETLYAAGDGENEVAFGQLSGAIDTRVL